MFLYATGFNTKYGATPCTMSYLTKMFRECELCSYLHLCVHVLFGTLIFFFFFSTSWTCFEKTARDLRWRGGSVSPYATCTWYSSQRGNGHCTTKLGPDPRESCCVLRLNFVIAVFFTLKTTMSRFQWLTGSFVSSFIVIWKLSWHLLTNNNPLQQPEQK